MLLWLQTEPSKAAYLYTYETSQQEEEVGQDRDKKKTQNKYTHPPQKNP